MEIKKKLGRIYGDGIWKFEESKRIVSIMFWVLTLSGIYLPYIEKELADVGFPIEAWILFFILMLLGFLGILTIGHIFDKMRLYEPDWQSKIQRQPFQTRLLTPKEQKLLANQARLFEGLQKNAHNRDFREALKELKGWAEKGEL